MADVVLSLWLQILLFYSATSPAGVLRQNSFGENEKYILKWAKNFHWWRVRGAGTFRVLFNRSWGVVGGRC